MSEKKEKKEKDVEKKDANKFIDIEPNDENVEEVDEALNISQRRQRSNSMRRNKAKIAAGRRRAKNKKASTEKLKKRARKKAIEMLKKRFSKNKNYNDMTDAEKQAIDKRIEKISSSKIDTLAKKLLPSVRRAEMEKGKQKNEAVETADLVESYSVLFNRLSEATEINLESFSNAFEAAIEAWEGETAPDADGLALVAEMINAFGDKSVAHFEDVNMQLGLLALESAFLEAPEGSDVFKIAESLVEETGLSVDAKDLAETFKDDFGSEYFVEYSIYIPAPTETLGITRQNMPQVASKDMPALIDFLAKRGVRVTKETVKARKLKATQCEFDKVKVAKAIDVFDAKEGIGKPILVSKDGYVIDGHHRWLAAYNTKSPIQTFQANINGKELVAILREFPKTFTKSIHESVGVDDDLLPLREHAFDVICEQDNSCPIITRSTMETFEKIVDKLFARFKIGFSFSKHFRERMGDGRNRPCIDMKELAELLKRLYAKVKDGKETLSKYLDTEVVLKDIQSNLNIPVAVEFDRKKDELDIRCKTVMRKKAFSTPNKVIKVN